MVVKQLLIGESERMDLHYAIFIFLFLCVCMCVVGYVKMFDLPSVGWGQVEI